ncbi:hypothetical protein ScPMuIL_006941 [Solemya velum]
MSTGLRTRCQSSRTFLLSGFSDEVRKDFGKKIQRLGSVYLKIDYFRSSCTHVICGHLSRSEKYLGACATGKWILHPDYITDSVENKKWLSEEDYEWSRFTCSPNVSLQLRDSPGRWRRMIQSTQLSAFSGWKVAVVVGSGKSVVYKRLLVSGGAEVYNMKLPVKKPEKVANFLTYVFVSSANASVLGQLMDYGVLCLRPSYIGDYLIQDPPPDPFNYIVTTEDSEENVSQVDLLSTPTVSIESRASCSTSTNSSQSTPGVWKSPSEDLALSCKKAEKLQQVCPHIGILQTSVLGGESSTEVSTEFKQSQQNNLLLLQFLLAALECNFEHFLQRLKDDGTAVSLHGCILAKVLWFPRYQVEMNIRCKELIKMFSGSLNSKLPQPQKNQLMKLIVSLISMATLSASIAEVGFTEDRLHSLRSRTADLFIHECARRIQYNALDRDELRHIMSCLQPSWFCLAVCQQILHSLDDYLVPGNNPVNFISLRLIVSRYFFLLPKLKRRSKIVSPNPILKGINKNIKETQHSIDVKKMNRVNKRNHKGETILHTACIKNDINKLDELLEVPGIDVNIKDNAGWTPLHEACNHGNLQCVTKLLNFVPAKNMEHLAQDSGSCKKVDLLAVSYNGLTPLHDSVLNNKLEICEALLQHGGCEQLDAKTVLGYTPMDLARFPDMKKLLLSFNRINLQNSNLWTPETDFLPSRRKEYQEITSPSEVLYDRILGSSEDRLCSEREDCAKYIDTVSYVLRCYIACTDIIRVRDALAPDVIEALLHSRANEQEDILDNKENKIPDIKNTEHSAEHNSQVSQTEMAILLDDLFVLQDMKKHFKNFREHLLKISSEIDMKLIESHCKFLYCLMKT